MAVGLLLCVTKTLRGKTGKFLSLSHAGKQPGTLQYFLPSGIWEPL